MKPVRITDPSDWKVAMTQHLARSRVSRYAFSRKLRDEKVCTTHTAECLLAEEGTATGNRVPSFALAIAMARSAGFDVVMIPRHKC